MNATLSSCWRAGFLIVALSSGLALSCTGTIDTPDEPGGSLSGDNPAGTDPGGVTDPAKIRPGMFVPPEKALAATVGLRRLSTNQFDATVRTLLGDQSGVGSHSLPVDLRGFFDSSAAQETQISDRLVSDVDFVASSIAASFANDDARRKRFMGCEPSQAGCLEEFVTRFGRLALRRPLTAEERQIYLQIPADAQRTGDFKKAVELIVSAFLQDLEFLHRIEVGTPVQGVAGLYKLDGYELASRLSYLLWGDMPSPELLDNVERGGLSTPDDVAATARKMLGDSRARDQIAFFHELWIGYNDIAVSGYPLALDMKNETNALIKKVVFDSGRPWQDLFRSDETFVSFELAQSYRLKMPAGFVKGSSPRWVPYAGTIRRGILSQTSVLRWGSKFGDTSPTKRGKQVRERLLCQPIPEPDPKELAKFNVSVDMPPKAANNSLCKWDRYEANRNLSPVCASCHDRLDLIGFGLENFDALGRYRAEQYWTKDAAGLAAPAAAGKGEKCAVRADGQVDGKPFSDPTGLADLLIASGGLTECALQQFYRFGTARDGLDDVDRQFVDRFKKYIGTSDFDFGDVLLKFVSSPAFAHRRMDPLN